MKLQRYVLFITLLFVAVTFAFTSEDHEIFRVRDELNSIEDKEISFYDFLGVPVSASLDDINKQYRKKSRQLHPDKAIPSLLAQRELPKKSANKKKPGVTVTKGATQKERAAITKEANERYAHLGVVVSILRGPQRERYDHFLKNGFPLWRGTGYYYKRFRPGLISVLLGLFVVFGGAGHYGAMYVSYRRQKDFVTRYVTHARRTAWGNETGIPGVPGTNGTLNGSATTQAPLPPPPPAVEQEDPNGGMALNRRQKRMQEKDGRKKDITKHTRKARLSRAQGVSEPQATPETSGTVTPQEAEVPAGPVGSKKKIRAENGKVLIVDSEGNVYLEEMTEEGDTNEFLLDPDEIQPPSFAQTAVVRLPVWAYNRTLGRIVGEYITGSSAASEPFLDHAAETALNVTISDEDHQEVSLGAASAPNKNAEIRKRNERAGRQQ